MSHRRWGGRDATAPADFHWRMCMLVARCVIYMGMLYVLTLRRLQGSAHGALHLETCLLQSYYLSARASQQAKKSADGWPHCPSAFVTDFRNVAIHMHNLDSSGHGRPSCCVKALACPCSAGAGLGQAQIGRRPPPRACWRRPGPGASTSAPGARTSARSPGQRRAAVRLCLPRLVRVNTFRVQEAWAWSFDMSAWRSAWPGARSCVLAGTPPASSQCTAAGCTCRCLAKVPWEAWTLLQVSTYASGNIVKQGSRNLKWRRCSASPVACT